jgi:hypothetical protein
MSTSTTTPGPILSDIMRQLKEQKYRKEFLESVVPAWWTPDVENDPGAVDHVKLILARALGLDATSLLRENRVVPVAPTGMQFKRSIDLENVAPPSPNLAYYSRIAKAIASVLEPSLDVPQDPLEMHAEILRESGEPYVSLGGIVKFCWSRNIAVVHVDDMPAGKKGFDALVYPHGGRYVIFLAMKFGPEACARASFIIAHELGHIAMGDVEENSIFVDDPANDAEREKGNEPHANKFAGEVLSGGRYNPKWRGRALSAELLAERAMEFSEEAGIDPGHLVMRYAWESKKGYGAPVDALFLLDTIMDCDVHQFVNGIAREHIAFDPLSKEAKALLHRSLVAV